LRVIEEGLRADDWVVTGGLQQVRPRMQVSPEELPMPTFGSAEGQTPPPGNNRAQPPPPGASQPQPGQPQQPPAKSKP